MRRFASSMITFILLLSDAFDELVAEYMMPPIEHIMYSISLQVKVPVLSEKIYWT